MSVSINTQTAGGGMSGGGSNLPTATAWSTTWDTAGYKDKGEYTITGALAIVSDDTGSVAGGCTQAVLIANGTNVPTFDGSALSSFVNTNGARNLAQLFRAGDSKFWAAGSVIGAAVTVATAPAIGVAPSVGSATVGVALTFTAASSVTGYPAPTVTYDVLIGGSVVATNVTSGSYTPVSAGGSLVVRATATNASGTAQASSSPVTVAAAATVPGAPTGLTLGTPGSTSQPLSWTAPASDGGSALTDYVVQYALAGSGSWSTFSDGTSTATSATVTGLSSSTNYDYRVAAVNAVGQGSYSSTSTGATTASASLYLDATSNTAVAAHSLRKLRSAYAGSCIKVRRSSDNATQDIGFSGNDLNTSALLTFCGAGDGFIDTWYDQSGNGNNLSASGTFYAQPQIVASGVVTTKNGKPSALITTAHQLACAISSNPTASRLFSMVVNISDSTGTIPLDTPTTGSLAIQFDATTRLPYVVRRNTAVVGNKSTVALTVGTMSALDIGINSTTLDYNVDNSTSTTPNGGTSSSGAPAWTASTGFWFPRHNGNASEFVVFDQAAQVSAADRLTLRQNQKSYWGTP